MIARMGRAAKSMGPEFARRDREGARGASTTARRDHGPMRSTDGGTSAGDEGIRVVTRRAGGAVMTKNSLLIALAAAAILLMAATPGGATIVSPPSDDAGTSQESPNGNTGSLYLIWVRNANGAGGAIWQMDGLFRFDLSEMPAAWPVTSAHLYIYYHGWWDNNPAGHALPAFRITSAWSESTVTWNNAPPSVAGATSTATVPGAGGQWMVWDVTADVQVFAGGTPNYGWRITDPVYWGGEHPRHEAPQQGVHSEHSVQPAVSGGIPRLAEPCPGDDLGACEGPLQVVTCS